LDDGSTDGTWEWICAETEGIHYRSLERVGHTILYDKGIELATNEVVGIIHADMIIGPNYVENLTKHLKPGVVVCATRVEPPLHPPGKEKIIKDFGQDFDTLDVEAFEAFCAQTQDSHNGEVTKGMFAPWILYKKDFQAIGGHDPLFAPFPYEDSDIFQRWILAGYELVQSRDALVYHLTCRGHRWNEQVGKDDDYYKVVSHRAARNYLRKWGSWIKNDEYQYPIIPSKYNVAYVIKSCTYPALEALEPWCDRIYLDDEKQVIIDFYIQNEQANTKFDLKKRVLTTSHNYPEGENDIVVEFDVSKLIEQAVHMLQQLPEIIKDSGEVGSFELGELKITISAMNEYQNQLINL
jgi:glycosyltransferase involved in cell wall biosynthesis